MEMGTDHRLAGLWGGGRGRIERVAGSTAGHMSNTEPAVGLERQGAQPSVLQPPRGVGRREMRGLGREATGTCVDLR